MKCEQLAVRAVVLLLALLMSVSCIGTSRSELIDTPVAETLTAMPITRTAQATPTATPAPKVALVSFHGRYVTALGEDDAWALKQEPELRECGMFTPYDLDNGKIALLTCHGRYVTAPRRGTTRWDWALWQDSALGDCGQFVPHDMEGDEVAFETCAGQFLTAGDGSWGSGLAWMVVAETDRIEDWEHFTLLQP